MSGLSAYRKAIVAFIGFTVIVLTHLTGVLHGASVGIVDSIVAALTWLWVYIVPNTPPPTVPPTVQP